MKELKSHPVRDAWIEIYWHYWNGKDDGVASREGCVD